MQQLIFFQKKRYLILNISFFKEKIMLLKFLIMIYLKNKMVQDCKNNVYKNIRMTIPDNIEEIIKKYHIEILQIYLKYHMEQLGI